MMKNKSRKLRKLKFNKNIISNFNSYAVIGGATEIHTMCLGCPSYSPDQYCPGTDTDIIVNPVPGSILVECPSMNPDLACDVTSIKHNMPNTVIEVP